MISVDEDVHKIHSITWCLPKKQLEDADDARVLLAVAVERVPHSVEMWLARIGGSL